MYIRHTHYAYIFPITVTADSYVPLHIMVDKVSLDGMPGEKEHA